MERNDMQKKYIIPSVEVVDLYAEQGVMMQTSEKWTGGNLSKKREVTTTSSTSIWNNNQND